MIQLCGRPVFAYQLARWWRPWSARYGGVAYPSPLTQTIAVGHSLLLDYIYLGFPMRSAQAITIADRNALIMKPVSSKLSVLQSWDPCFAFIFTTNWNQSPITSWSSSGLSNSQVYNLHMSWVLVAVQQSVGPNKSRHIFYHAPRAVNRPSRSHQQAGAKILRHLDKEHTWKLTSLQLKLEDGS